jgi:hypothetical protein
LNDIFKNELPENTHTPSIISDADENIIKELHNLKNQSPLKLKTLFDCNISILDNNQKLTKGTLD